MKPAYSVTLTDHVLHPAIDLKVNRVLSLDEARSLAFVLLGIVAGAADFERRKP